MSTTITGTVIGVTKGKPYTSKLGPLAGKTMVTNKILIETDTGQTTVQKNSMATTNFTLASGTKVQATYEEKTHTTASGDSFVNNNLVKDGLLVLTDEGAPLQVSASGTPKPAFVPGSGSTGGGATKTGSTYNSEGARNGMIVNASLALATARKDVSISALLAAADDIKALTKYVEEGVVAVKATSTTTASTAGSGKLQQTSAKTTVRSLPKAAVIEDEYEEDESNPFD